METIRKKIVIIGAGPAGVGAALRLDRGGHRNILILDRFSRIGGIPAQYPDHGKPTFILWSKGRIRHGITYADSLAEKLNGTGIETWLKSTVIRFDPVKKEIHGLSSDNGFFRIEAEAILFACGARESTTTERRRIFGQRPARVFHTFHLLQFLKEKQGIMPARQAIAGAESVSYATAEKLVSDLHTPVILDPGKSAFSSVFSRGYFFRGRSPQRIPGVCGVSVRGEMGVKEIHLETTPPATIPVDYLYLCGQFVPNTELLSTAEISMDADTRQVASDSIKTLRQRGIFIAGNMNGAISGGEGAYFSGVRAGRQITSYLGRPSS